MDCDFGRIGSRGTEVGCYVGSLNDVVASDNTTQCAAVQAVDTWNVTVFFATCQHAE